MCCPGIFSLINVYTETYSHCDQAEPLSPDEYRLDCIPHYSPPCRPRPHCDTQALPPPPPLYQVPGHPRGQLSPDIPIDLNHFQSLVNHHHSSCPKHGHINLEVINSSVSANNASLSNGQAGAGGDQGGPTSQSGTSQSRRVPTLQQDTKEILKNYRERAICIVSMIYHPPSLHQYRQLY